MARKTPRSGKRADRPAAAGTPDPRFGLRAIALEARYMFDAAAVATGAEVLAQQTADQQAEAALANAAHQQAEHAAPAAATDDKAASHDPAATDATTHADAPAGDAARTQDLGDALAGMDAPQERSGTQIVFIDGSVENAQTLLQGIDPSAEVVFLDRSSDGLTQIEQALQGRTDVGAIHILSHGDPGQIRLGDAVYDNAALSERAADLAAIGAALSADGDILLYGCDTAEGVLGQQFTHSLARLTGADVAASDDVTGAARLGGDWQLEYRVGQVDTAVVVDERTQALFDSTLNALSLNAAAGLIYYFDGSSTTSRALFAYDYVNNTHILIDSDITDAGSVVVAGSQGVSGGGAAFANGTMYLGVENITGTTSADRIYRRTAMKPRPKQVRP